MDSVNFFAMVLALIGPPATQPTTGEAEKGLKLKAGDQIIAMGDSITQAGGYLRVMDAVFAQQYPDLKIPGIVNVGIGGQKAEDMVKRFEKDVVSKKPAVVTINVGINDVWHRMDKPHDEEVLKEYARNVERMVKMAQNAKIRVYLISPTIIEEDPKAEGNVRLAKYIAAGKDIARRNKCEYVDLHALFLKAIEQNARKAKGKRFLTTDGVHMLPPGDTLMAAGILRALGVPDEKMKATDLTKVFAK